MQVRVQNIKFSFVSAHLIDRVYPHHSPNLLHLPEHKYKEYPSLSSCSKNCMFANEPIVLNWPQRHFPFNFTKL